MAHHFNADEAKSLHDPITFTLSGKRYEVVEFSQQIMDALDDIQARHDAGEITLDRSINEQLELLTSSEPGEFDAATFRVKTGIIGWITDAVQSSIGSSRAKNARRT